MVLCDNFLINFSLYKFSPQLIYLFIFVELIVRISECARGDGSKHLEIGREFLSKGQLSDALTHYHAAIEVDPDNFVAYYQRGTVYLALGKSKLALSDLDVTLKLKPDFIAARLSRGKLYLKLADFEHAKIDLYDVLQSEATNEEAINLINRIEPSVNELQYVYSYMNHDDYNSAIHILNNLIETCPWSSKLRKLRSECYMNIGDSLLAINDLRSATKLENDDTEGYYELAELLYVLGRVSESLKEIRECLKLDPEHKKCFPFYKKIKKIEKQMVMCEEARNSNNYIDCIEAGEKALRLNKEDDTPKMVVFYIKQQLCHCYSKNEDSSIALTTCTEALEIHKLADLYCDRAEAYIQTEMYDDAIRDYKQALELEENSSRAKDGLKRAQKLQHQSEQRDYYKILDVKRSATKKEIIKAYRKAAQKWHPDNFPDGDEKKRAEKKFIDIAAAKEVLTDDEKRAKFDRGEDPLDPERGNSNFHPGDGFPFHGGNFHFQGGSPFQFKFHFP